MNAIRWLLVLPLMAAGFLAGVAAAIAIFVLGEWTCPAEHIVSNSCNAPWTMFVFNSALCCGAALSAALSVLFAALLAPVRKTAVAYFALATGTLATANIIYMELFSRGFELSDWDEVTSVFLFAAAVAIGSGYLALNVVRRWEASPWLWQESRS